METTVRDTLPVALSGRPGDRYLEVEGLRIRYWEEGVGSPVLLIHGFGASCEYWQWNFQPLAEHFRAIALDLPGHGLSEKRIPNYSATFAADFLANFLPAMNIERAHIVGKSLGGALALALAVYHPQRVEKLVLVNSAGLGRELGLGFRLLAIPVLRDILTIPNRLGIKIEQRSLAHRREAVSEEWVDAVYSLAKRSGRRQAVLGIAKVGVDLGGQRREAWEPVFKRLGEIQAPTLIVWGANDPVLPVTHAHTAHRIIPDSRLEIIESCGHLTQMEVPEVLNRLLIDFLQEE